MSKLEEIELAAGKCALCELHKTRTKPVFAKGNPKSPIMVVGMIPGPEENRVGVPFVGRAGQLLDTMLNSAGIDDPYVTNLVKCWLKPGLPLKDEWIDPCLQYILAQIWIVKPRVIVTLGKDASVNLMSLKPADKVVMGKIRGQIFHYSTCEMFPCEIVPTYHPSYLLRGGGEKHDQYPKVLEDLALANHIAH